MVWHAGRDQPWSNRACRHDHLELARTVGLWFLGVATALLAAAVVVSVLGVLRPRPTVASNSDLSRTWAELQVAASGGDTPAHLANTLTGAIIGHDDPVLSAFASVIDERAKLLRWSLYLVSFAVVADVVAACLLVAAAAGS